MSLHILTYDRQNALQELPSLAALHERSEDSVAWVDLESADPALLEEVRTLFGLHELTIEDCLTPEHFPKMEEFSNYLFIIMRGLHTKPLPPEEDPDYLEGYTRKVAMYIGKNFVITHRLHEIPWLDAAVRQIKQSPERSITLGADALAHSIVDILIDRFERNLDIFERRVDQLEEHAIAGVDDFKMVSILDTKRELISLRQIARAQRNFILRLAGDKSDLIRAKRRRYFKDIDDHALSVIYTIDQLIDTLQGVRDAYFANANVRLGDTMRILAVITTILAPLNIAVGLYGMNFEVMPLVHSPNGFWFMVMALLMITVALLIYFRRMRWI